MRAPCAPAHMKLIGRACAATLQLPQPQRYREQHPKRARAARPAPVPVRAALCHLSVVAPARPADGVPRNAARRGAAENSLEGTIPSELAQLTSLTFL